MLGRNLESNFKAILYQECLSSPFAPNKKHKKANIRCILMKFQIKDSYTCTNLPPMILHPVHAWINPGIQFQNIFLARVFTQSFSSEFKN